MRTLRLMIMLFTLPILVFILLTIGKFVHADEGVPVFNDSISDEEGKVINSEVKTGFNASIDYNNPAIIDSNLKVEKIVDGLNFSTSMTFLGPNDILVLEKEKGTVQRMVNGSIQEEPLLDVPVNNMGGRGMLGIAVAKHENGGPTYVFLYFTLSSTPKDTHNLTDASSNHLYRYEFKDNKLTNQKLLLNVTAISPKQDGGHNGGKMRIGPDQNIYLIVGDLREHATKAQNNLTGLPPDGTSVIYRITQDGMPAPDNPLGKNKLVNKYYAYGIRNSFGLDFDPVTGKLWDTENGPDYGDEINLVEPGFNSGWKRQQGFLVNSYYPDEFVNIGERGKAGIYSDPEFVWNQTVAPTALKFLNSDKLGSQYNNDMFVGDAKFGNIYHFDLRDNRTKLAIYTPLADKIADNVKELESIIFGQGFGRITDLEVGPDGYLYVLTNNKDEVGAVFRIVPIQSIIPKQSTINLLDNNQTWKPFNEATLSQNNGTLSINVDTNMTKEIYNRAFLPTKINHEINKTLLLNLDYVSKSDMSNATFLAEIRDNSSKVLWSSPLNDTSGQLSTETFTLPSNIVNRPVEFRLYIITNSPGEHALTVKKAAIIISNVTE